MRTLVTFATPHLGCVNGQSALVNSGLKFLSKISSHKALHQMSLSDASEIKNCFLMSLSKYEGLDWFQNVILFSSHQDYYVPFESARVEYGSWAKDQKGKGKYLRQMADNILGRLSTERLVRVDMNFTLEKSFDTAFIGRRAHVMVLDSFKLQAIFAYFYSVYFQ